MAQQIVFNNRYRVLGLVGEGGMAKVYKAEDRLLERAVAVKVLREQYSSDQEFVERFRQEARSAAGMAHPNIVSVYDVGIDNGLNYIVMEYIEGPSLKDLVRQGAPFTSARAVDIAIQVLSGLSFAHQKGLIHRDVKPQNILVAADGTVKVTDFGIARAATSAQLTETGVVLGTVHYFSPEQAKGETATPASDIYSVGIVLYEMLTGRLPFDGDSTLGIALKHLQESPPLPSRTNPRVPPSLERITLKAMAKEPSVRYMSAEDMKLALAGYRQEGEQVTAPVRVVPVPPRGRSATIKPVSSMGRIQPKRKGVDWFVITLAVLILGFGVASVPVAAKVYDLYFAPGPVAAPIASPMASPTRQAPTATPSVVPRVAVPSLIGLPYADAKQLLEAQNLQIRTVDEVYNDKIAPTAIISQSAEADSQIRVGSVIDVVVSKGVEQVSVPDVLGDILETARSQLTAAGLKVSSVEDYSDRIARGRVIAENPPANSPVPKASTVELTISLGKQPPPTPLPTKTPQISGRVIVPSLIGLPEDEARLRIDSAGLANTFTNYQGPGDIPDAELVKVQPGQVLSQQPPPGTVVAPGTTVYLAVRKQ